MKLFTSHFFNVFGTGFILSLVMVPSFFLPVAHSQDSNSGTSQSANLMEEHLQSLLLSELGQRVIELEPAATSLETDAYLAQLKEAFDEAKQLPSPKRELGMAIRKINKANVLLAAGKPEDALRDLDAAMNYVLQAGAQKDDQIALDIRFRAQVATMPTGQTAQVKKMLEDNWPDFKTAKTLNPGFVGTA